MEKNTESLNSLSKNVISILCVVLAHHPSITQEYAHCNASILTLCPAVSVLWKLLYMFCCFLVLVPSPLLEFRYFILPFIILKLQASNIADSLSKLQTLVFAVINLILLHVFLFRPFPSSSSSSKLSRFMF